MKKLLRWILVISFFFIFFIVLLIYLLVVAIGGLRFQWVIPVILVCSQIIWIVLLALAKAAGEEY